MKGDSTWTVDKQAWLDEVIARMPEPTVHQLDVVRAEFRKVARSEAGVSSADIGSAM